MTITVAGEPVSFTVDTGARYSTLTALPGGLTLSADTVSLTGFDGKPAPLHLTTPANVNIAHQLFSHQFVYAPQCPINLLGRDILISAAPMIKCSPDGI